MIGAREADLTAGAELALVDRVERVALELDRAAFAGLHVKTAGRGALGARRRVVDGDAGRDLFGLDDVGDELVRGFAADGGGGSRGEADDLQKIATIEFGHAVLVPLDLAQ